MRKLLKISYTWEGSITDTKQIVWQIPDIKQGSVSCYSLNSMSPLLSDISFQFQIRFTDMLNKSPEKMLRWDQTCSLDLPRSCLLAGTPWVAFSIWSRHISGNISRALPGMMSVTMVITVALRYGDSILSRTEWCPPAAEKGGKSCSQLVISEQSHIRNHIMN